MPKWLRALIAGYGAKKLGGGCFSTILVFILIYYALGQCNQGNVRRQGNVKNAEHNQTAQVKPIAPFHFTGPGNVIMPVFKGTIPFSIATGSKALR